MITKYNPEELIKMLKIYSEKIKKFDTKLTNHKEHHCDFSDYDKLVQEINSIDKKMLLQDNEISNIKKNLDILVCNEL